MKKGRFLLFFCFLLLLSGFAFAENYYVSKGGWDGHTGLSWNTAFYTIQHALDVASDDDVITVNTGRYFENIDFNGVSCVLQSKDPEDISVVKLTIIEGRNLDSVVVFENGETAEMAGFTIKNGNAAGSTWSEQCGGGILVNGASPVIRRCLIMENNAVSCGGGVANLSGEPRYEMCQFYDNTAAYGAAGYNGGDADSPFFYHCIVRENSATTSGGAFYNYDCYPKITSCVIAYNEAGSYGGGMYNEDLCTAEVLESIMWVNLAGSDGNEVYNDSGDANFSYSCVYDCYDTSDNWRSSLGTNCGGNIELDPNFINPDVNDYHITWDSPCKDAGDPDAKTDPNVYINGSVDFDGDPRLMGASRDIGCYELGGVFRDPNNWYHSVVDAMADASNGDVITVYPGTYYGRLDFDGKAITVKGMDPDNWEVVGQTIISADNNGVCVTFDQYEDANSILSGLTIADGNESLRGGGIFVSYSSPLVEKCIIKDNFANDGGGMYIWGSSSPTISNCFFYHNRGLYTGGGIRTYLWSTGYPLIENCAFAKCAAPNGGGLYLLGVNNSIDVVNCSFGECAATTGRGGAIYNYSNPMIVNSAFGDNVGYVEGDTVYNYNLTYDPNFRNCCMPDCKPGGVWDPNFGTDGGGNIDSEPNFTDAYDAFGDDGILGTADDGWSLTAQSPCIDAGDGDWALSEDIKGDDRVDDPNVTNTGTGSPAYSDIGAYEFNN